MPYTIGDFELRFAPDGKLDQLQIAGQNLLLDLPHEVDMGGGRLFQVAGWDECFPTLDPYADSPVMGDLVGRPTKISQEDLNIRLEWFTPCFTVIRSFSLDSRGALQVTFQAQNVTTIPQEFLWASHALFPLAGLEMVILPEGRSLIDFSLDSSEVKWFIKNAQPVVISCPLGKITLETDQPWWGLWLNRGGWPADNQNQWGCFGIEATNTPGEIPQGQVLQPNSFFCGKVTLAISIY